MALGVYRIEGINPLSMMLPSVAMALSSGVFEELLHRGTIFRNVEEMLGSWIALVVSALFFGFRHLGNADGNIVGAMAITIEAGVLLAAVYLLTRRLWLSIGFHVAWNFTQSGVFSGSVSGAFEQPGLFRAIIEGPELLTGGKFGMEATVIALLVCTMRSRFSVHGGQAGQYCPSVLAALCLKSANVLSGACCASLDL